MIRYNQFIFENNSKNLWKDIEDIGYILSDENIYYTVVQYHVEFDWRIKNSKLLNIGEILKMGRIIRRLLGSDLFANLEISNLIKQINKNPSYIGTIIIHPSNTEFAYKTTTWFRNIDDNTHYLEYLDRIEETTHEYGFKLDVQNKVFLNIFK